MRKGEQGRATDGELVAIHEATGSLAGAGAVDTESRNVRVVLIRAGEAKSGRVFTQRALADIAAAADGLRCFADHPTALEDRLRPARSVRDIVGVFRSPRLVGNGGEAMRVEASLHVLEHADWLWQLVKEVVQLGEKDVIGLSIDALCTLVTESRAGRTVQIVQTVPVLKSCDVVTRASAGGEFLAIEESATAGSRRRQRPDARTAGRLLLPPAETAHQHTANSRGGNEVNAQTTVVESETPTERHEGQHAVREAAEQLACARILYDRLATARLPEPVKQKLRCSFEPPLNQIAWEAGGRIGRRGSRLPVTWTAPSSRRSRRWTRSANTMPLRPAGQRAAWSVGTGPPARKWATTASHGAWWRFRRRGIACSASANRSRTARSWSS